MTTTGKTRAGAPPRPEPSDLLYFFPEREVTVAEAKAMQAGTDEQLADLLSHLLKYAQWDDIWIWTSRSQVIELFPLLDLPEGLRARWAQKLKIESVATP